MFLNPATHGGEARDPGSTQNKMLDRAKGRIVGAKAENDHTVTQEIFGVSLQKKHIFFFTGKTKRKQKSIHGIEGNIPGNYSQEMMPCLYHT